MKPLLANWFGAGCIGAVLACVLVTDSARQFDAAPPPIAAAGTAAAPATPTPPPAHGHYVLVVEGDRDALAITTARHKPDPWAAAPRGLSADWRIVLHDAAGETLASVPLDVSQFAVGAAEKNAPVQVQGCVVRSSRIGLLVSVPAFATTAGYSLVRGPAERPTMLGNTTAAQLQTLVEGGR